MTVSLPWYLFYGHHVFHMQRQEILATRFNEMNDMISCLAVYNGNAKEIKKKSLSFDEALMLR